MRMIGRIELKRAAGIDGIGAAVENLAFLKPFDVTIHKSEIIAFKMNIVAGIIGINTHARRASMGAR